MSSRLVLGKDNRFLLCRHVWQVQSLQFKQLGFQHQDAKFAKHQDTRSEQVQSSKQGISSACSTVIEDTKVVL